MCPPLLSRDLMTLKDASATMGPNVPLLTRLVLARTSAEKDAFKRTLDDMQLSPSLDEENFCEAKSQARHVLAPFEVRQFVSPLCARWSAAGPLRSRPNRSDLKAPSEPAQPGLGSFRGLIFVSRRQSLSRQFVRRALLDLGARPQDVC